MDLGMIMGIIVSAGIITGGTIKGVGLMKNRKSKLLEDLGTIRDKMYLLSKTDEEARMVLEKSKNKILKGEKDLICEITKLHKSLENILEHRRKNSLIELEMIREQLNLLSLTNEQAKKELKKSFTTRITTEKAANRESDRLRDVIYIIGESERKELMDDITSLREQLQLIETDRSISVLNESFLKKDMSQKDMKKEITRLRSEIQNIKIENKKKYMQELKESRDRMYALSLECESAKEELNASFERKLVTVDDIKSEIENLNISYLDCIEINRRQKMSKLNEVRDSVYENSKNSEYARLKLEDSFNKLFSDQIIVKEIETLEETIDKVYRDIMMSKYKKDDELFL